jgi:hypothetical protein
MAFPQQRERHYHSRTTIVHHSKTVVDVHLGQKRTLQHILVMFYDLRTSASPASLAARYKFPKPIHNLVNRLS